MELSNYMPINLTRIPHICSSGGFQLNLTPSLKLKLKLLIEQS